MLWQMLERMGGPSYGRMDATSNVCAARGSMNEKKTQKRML